MDFGPPSHHHKIHSAASTDEYLYNQLIPYIGNKRKLLWLIDRAVQETGVQRGRFVDYFAGSGAVSRYAKKLGFSVCSNDWEPYASIINRCYIECSQIPAFEAFGGAQKAFELLNSLPPVAGYITNALCPEDDNNLNHDTERLFFTRANGMRIDSAREAIEAWKATGRISCYEESVLLASLLYGVCYVSNTSGVFKGFHRGWGGATGTALYRILSTLTLRMPVLFDNGESNTSECMDAQILAERNAARQEQADIAYLDPPYNQHPYGSNYHVLNTVALWDKPLLEDYDGKRNKSAIRKDWRTERRSAYNYDTALEAYGKLIETIPARYILTSYSTDGKIPVQEMLAAASTRGKIACVMHPYKRYRVSSQRMSRKPVNVEFVLVIDTQRDGKDVQAAKIEDALHRTEDEAVFAHRESELSRAVGFV